MMLPSVRRINLGYIGTYENSITGSYVHNRGESYIKTLIAMSKTNSCYFSKLNGIGRVSMIAGSC